MAIIGTNTIDVASSGYGSGSFQYQLNIVENSYDVAARTANVTISFLIKGVKSYYSSFSDSDASLSVTTSTGNSFSYSLNSKHSTTTSSWTTVGSYTSTVSYDADGNCVVNASATFGWSSSDGNYLPLNSTISTSGNCTNIGVEDPDQVEITFSATGAMQSFITPYPGTYTLECWGARGSGSYSYGNTVVAGGGGYAKGKYLTEKDKQLYIGCGGVGWTDSGDYTTGGWNGGGSGSSQYYRKGGAGGGCTHIALENNILRNCTASNVLIVAGGGGGGGDIQTAVGGNGGGTTGTNGSGSTGSGGYPYGGRAGTQTSSDSSSMVDTDSVVAGGFGYGGDGEKMSSSSYYGAGGGGGGWYGGTGGASYTNSRAGGGGGGSGYLNSILTDSTMNNTLNYRDSGKTKITYSHKKISYDSNGGLTIPESQDFAAPCSIIIANAIDKSDTTVTEDYQIIVDTKGGNKIDNLDTKLSYNATYNFKNWKDNSAEYAAGATNTFSDSSTLVAQWNETKNNLNYSQVSVPIPRKNATTTIKQEQINIILDANGGSW